MQSRLQSVLVGSSPRRCARHGRGAFPLRNEISDREETLPARYDMNGWMDRMYGVNKRKIAG